jgi:NAD(P)-dependent dehydrogenase (short-subunit alcohol dehydrogenase family)
MAGKRTIITGGASGFGEGLARGLAARGAYVALADINGDAARAAVYLVEQQYETGQALPVTGGQII